MKYFPSIIGFSLLTLAGCDSKSENNALQEATDLICVGDYTLGLEGPAVDQQGNLYFVNPVKNGTIGKVSIPDNSFELFIDSLPNGSIANGMRFSTNGTIYLADYTNHNLLRVNPDTRKVEVFANNMSMNQPNDLAITATGILFASDPDWAAENGNIWRIDSTGTSLLLESGMGTTNGIEVALGDSLLYVNESVQRRIWSYQLSADGSISNKKLLLEFPDHGLDGMRSDAKGNLFVARYGKGTIAIISPEGNILSEVKLKGQKPTNIAFGGKDGRTCYITCQDRGYIETFRTDYPGRSWILNQ